MNGIVMMLLLLVVPGYDGGEQRDKSGTSGFENEPMVTKMLEKQEPAEAGSFLAERGGDYLGVVVTD
jgi:hypothetical protein